MSLIGIFVGLILLIVLAYRGHSIIWVAPLCAVIVALFSGMDLLQAYLGDYINGTQPISFPGFPHSF